ncbi:MAG: hypothetical protein JWP72_3172 [Massilia sp.]|nr:hypothetical protein [Massilia sp.]
MDMLETLIRLVILLNSNHYAAVVLIALALINRPPPKN